MSANLRIELISASGHPDIGVTSLRPSSFPELHWAEPTLPPTVTRRAMLLPVRVTNDGTEPLILADKSTQPDDFITLGFLPMLKNLFGLTLMKSDESGDTVRSLTFTAPMIRLVKGNEARIDPAESIQALARMCFFDVSAIPKGQHFALFEVDPLNRYGGYASAFFFWAIESYSVREIS